VSYDLRLWTCSKLCGGYLYTDPDAEPPRCTRIKMWTARLETCDAAMGDLGLFAFELTGCDLTSMPPKRG